jgi:pimeloyl-ACP methyl ester carboxylesterase
MPFIKRNDVEIYFETQGHGAPLMFFSETACAGDVWSIFQVPEFGRDHTVITHDYRGTGRSTNRPSNIRRRTSSMTPWRFSNT